MKTLRSAAGPFGERPFYPDEEIERICSDALVEAELMPRTPEAIRIERFVEKRFNTRVIYELLDRDVLGFTVFGPSGVEAVHVSATEGESKTPAARRRVNATLAHEAGHGLLHAHLFLSEFDHRPLFAQDPDVGPTRVLCRDDGARTSRARRGYDGRWWELQANRAIGALLLPKQLVVEFLTPYLEKRGIFERLVLPDSGREAAIQATSTVFDVNPVVARIRIEGLFPQETGQLTL